MFLARPKDYDPAEKLAERADTAYKATVGVGGALWKYATFGFGDVAIQQISSRVARRKLENVLKNDGWTIHDISTSAEPLWRVSKDEGTDAETNQFINPDRIVRKTGVKSLAELVARYGEVPHTMSANDKLAYNIGGSLGTFSRLVGGAAGITKHIPVGIKGARAIQFGAAGTATDLIGQLEMNLSERKPFDFVQAGKKGAIDALLGLGVGTIEQVAGAWRIHKFLGSDAGMKAMAQKLSIREKMILADAAKMGSRIEDARVARDLLKSVRIAEGGGTSVKGAPPKSVLEKIVASPKMSVDMWHVRFDKPLAKVMSKLGKAAKEAGWKAPGIKDLPASVVEDVKGVAPAKTYPQATKHVPGVRPELQKYTKAVDEGADQLQYYTEWKLVKKGVAPEAPTQAYRPAVLLKDGTILWHPKASMHADAIALTRNVDTFDFNSIKSAGGIAPSGDYYDQGFEGDTEEHMVRSAMEHPITVRPSAELGRVIKREPTIRESLYHKKVTEAAAKAVLDKDQLHDEDYLRMARAEYPHLSKKKQKLAADFIKKQTGINMRNLSRRTAAESMLATGQVSGSKGFVKPEDRSGARTLFHERSSRPLALFEQMGDYRPDNMLSENLFWLPSKGRDAQYAFKIKAENMVREWLKRSEWTNAELDSFSPALALNPMLAKKRSFKLSSGKTINAYDGTLMDILMQSTHKNNLRSALDAPFYLGDKKYPPLTKKDISHAYKELVDRYGVSKIQALRDIAFQVGQQGKKFANAASRKVHGYSVFNVASYWPIMRAEHSPRFGGRQYRELSSVIEESGFAQERKEYSNLPIVIGDYFGKLHRTINNTSIYGGMLEPATRSKLMLKDRALRDIIRKKFGSTALDTIDSYVRDMEDISKYHSPVTGFLTQRMHKAILSALGAHLIVAPKQIISGIFLLNYTDIGTFLDVLTSQSMEDAMRLHDLYSPQVSARYRDTRIGRDIYVRANARKAFTDRETVEGMMMMGIREMDKEVVARQAAGIAVAELKKLGIVEGDPRFGDAFNRSVVRMISGSQPAWDSLYRSEIGRSRDLMTRMLTLFHSQREAIMSMGMDAAHKYRVTGDISPVLKTGGLIFTTAVMFATVNALAKKYVYGKKDYGWKDFLAEEIPLNLLSIPFFGEIAAYVYVNVERGLRGKPVFQTEAMDFIVFAPLEHATRAMVYMIQAAREMSSEELEKGEWKWRKTALRAADEIVQAVAPWYGLPIFPYRLGKGIVRQIMAEPEKEKPIKP